MITLKELDIGEFGMIREILFQGRERRRMLDLGFVIGTVVEAVQKSPPGDPVAYYLRGTVIALRNDDAANVLIEKI